MSLVYPSLIIIALIRCIFTSLYININSYTISFTNPLSIPISNNFTSSTCGKLTLRNNHLYHLNTNQILQIWQLSTPIFNTIQYSRIDSNKIIDFDVDYQQNYLSLLSQHSTHPRLIQFGLGKEGTASFIQNLTYSPLPSKISTYGNLTYKYYQQLSGDIIVIQSNNQSIILNKTLPHSNNSLSFSSDHQYAATWTKYSQIYIYKTSNFLLQGIYNGSIINNTYRTNMISFSPDNSYFIAETDCFKNVTIVKISNLTVYKSFAVNFTIVGSFFINMNWTLIFGENQTLLWCHKTFGFSSFSLLQLNSYIQLFAETFAFDENKGLLVTCSNNSLNYYYINQIKNPIIPSNISNNSILNNQPNHSISITTFSKQIQLSNTQSVVYQHLNQIVDFAGQNIFQKILLFAISTPLTFYFLSFINFLNFSTLYVLFTSTVPTQAFQILSKIYFSINQNIFQAVGIQVNIPQLTNSCVNDQKSQYFGISSDVFSFNILALLVVLMNILVSELLNFFGLRFKKQQFLRKILIQNRFQVISGQLISLIISFTVVWRFTLLSSSFNLAQKLNISCQYLLFFIAFSLPIFYLFLLINKQKKQISPLNQQSTKSSLNHLNSNTQKGLRSLLNGQLLEEWYICFCNFIYPFLSTLNQPLIFLSLIFIICMTGVIIAWRTSKWRWNTIVLSLYPLFYHCCFIAFHISTNDNTIANIGIFSICVLFIGAFHNFGTIIANTVRIVRKLRKEITKIQPEIGQLQIIKIECQQLKLQTPSSNFEANQVQFAKQITNNCECFPHKMLAQIIKNRSIKVKTVLSLNQNKRLMIKSQKTKNKIIPILR